MSPLCFGVCSEVEVEDLQREIRLLAQCRSPHITRYHGSVIVPGTSQLWIIMEVCHYAHNWC